MGFSPALSEYLNFFEMTLPSLFDVDLERLAFRTGIRNSVSERVSLIQIHSPPVSAGFTFDASLDRSNFDFCSLGNRSLEHLSNPERNLLHIEKRQLSDL